MCRVEERIYINRDGHRSKFEEAFPCDKSRNGKLCSKVKKRTTEYWPKKGVNGRDDSLSPLNPPTPTSSGSYIVQPVRPSSSGERPSTREGPKAIKPEIVIEFGSSKGKGKKYPLVSVSTQSQKRSSLASVGSNEVAIDSPGSDASYTMRTGFPETSLPPQAPMYHRSDGYSTTPIAPRPHHHRHTSSTSSYTGSSQPPSLYVTSDPDHDSPENHRRSKYSSTVVHNPSPPATHSSPSRPRVQTKQSTSEYSTTVVTPTRYAQDTHTPDGLFPLDYPADRSASSYASSAVSGGSRHAKESSRKKSDDRRRQEDLDRAAAEAKEENIKQVRFELGRAESRTKERAENSFAEKEKQRAADREEARRRKEPEREPRATQESKKHKSRTASTDQGAKQSSKPRRLSMTQAQMEEQRRLLAADLAHMQGESVVANALEREERNALLRQQQQDPNYYNPRVLGTTSAVTASNGAPISRRDSVSSRRRSITSTDALHGLSRSNSARRPNVSQPNPPVSTQVTSSHGRPPSARTHQAPPVSFPANFNARPPSARRPSFSSQENPSARRPSFSSHENPFAAPPTRGSGSSVDNPFAPAPQILSPSALIHQDPWDVRNVTEALPSARPISDGRYTMERRGLDVINNAGSHHAARQATRAMRGATEYDDYAVSSEDERTHGHARRRR